MREPVYRSVDPFIDERSLDVGAGDDNLLDPRVKFWDSDVG